MAATNSISHTIATLIARAYNATESIQHHHNFPYAPHAHNPLLSEWISPEIIASWPPPNFIDPETKHAEMFAWELVLLSAAVIAVVLRLYVRIRLVRHAWAIGWDDWGIAIALLFAIGLTTVQLNATQYGYGMHIWDVRHEWFMPMRKMAFSAQILFIFCTTTTKISILYFYLRLSVSPNFRLLVYLGAAFVFATGVSFIFVIVFQCMPISGYWDLTLPQSRCVDESAANIANAVLNSVSDLYVFLLPIKSMLGLRLPLRQRIGIVVLFSLGAVVCIAGWLRIWQLADVLRRTYDNTWYGPTLYILTTVECDVAIVCGCLPALKPLMAKFLPGLRRLSFRRLSGAVIVGHDGSGRRSSADKNGRKSSADKNGKGLTRRDSGWDDDFGKNWGGLCRINSEYCPYSDPSKFTPLPTRPPMARLTAGGSGAVNSANRRDSNIVSFEDMLSSASRLPMHPHGESSSSGSAENGARYQDLEKGDG
ncbi:hypothetical protein ABW21_db0208306 [Orbilia brochopaga]|nr:hypothetical protein ABW21_db0208306 [Drechslerella brochopaga]